MQHLPLISKQICEQDKFNDFKVISSLEITANLLQSLSTNYKLRTSNFIPTLFVTVLFVCYFKKIFVLNINFVHLFYCIIKISILFNCLCMCVCVCVYVCVCMRAWVCVRVHSIHNKRMHSTMSSLAVSVHGEVDNTEKPFHKLHNWQATIGRTFCHAPVQYCFVYAVLGQVISVTARPS